MSAEDCNHHQGTWSGRTGELGTCIIPAYSDTSLTEQQCNAIQGTYIPESDSTCLFNSHNWTPLEDPCQMPHNVNFNKSMPSLSTLSSLMSIIAKSGNFLLISKTA